MEIFKTRFEAPVDYKTFKELIDGVISVKEEKGLGIDGVEVTFLSLLKKDALEVILGGIPDCHIAQRELEQIK